MNNIFQTKIDIFIASKSQEVFDKFLEGFLATTKDFKDIRLFVIHKNSHILPKLPNIISYPHEKYGGTVRNEILVNYTLKEPRDVFGDLNDDLWFKQGWLEDCLQALNHYDVISPGTADTNDLEMFEKAIGETTDEKGIIDFPNAACWFFNRSVFRRVGLFPEWEGWEPLDLDMIWKMFLNKVKMGSLKKITTAHLALVNKKRTYKDDRTTGKKVFYDRHGYQSYRDIINLARPYRSYFWRYKKFV